MQRELVGDHLSLRSFVAILCLERRKGIGRVSHHCTFVTYACGCGAKLPCIPGCVHVMLVQKVSWCMQRLSDLVFGISNFAAIELYRSYGCAHRPRQPRRASRAALRPGRARRPAPTNQGLACCHPGPTPAWTLCRWTPLRGASAAERPPAAPAELGRRVVGLGEGVSRERPTRTSTACAAVGAPSSRAACRLQAARE